MGYFIDDNTLGGAAGGGSSSYIPPLPGEPGSTIFATLAAGNGTPDFGELRPGSKIWPGTAVKDLSGQTNFLQISSSNTPVLSGTWACAGDVLGSLSITCWTRIDTGQTLNSTMLSSRTSPVRDLRYGSEDGKLIDCEVFYSLGSRPPQWYPFTANADDCTEWGRELYARAEAGVYGPVALWVDPEIQEEQPEE